MFLLMLWLGMWQLDRARQKEARHAEYVANQRLAPCASLGCLSVLAGQTTSLGHRVTLSNPDWMPQRILLDNQVHQGKAGYLLLQVLDTRPAILVQRAWVGAAPERDELPPMPTFEEGDLLRAALAWPPATGLQFAATAPAEPMGPDTVRLQSLDRQSLSALLGREIAPMILRELPVGAGGPMRPWREPASGADRHRAYALQWFSMSAVLVLVYWNYRRQRHGAPDH